MSPALLKVTGLTKRFGGLVAADEVSFELDRGECVALIGPNGAGKTTVFSLIAGELEADAGTVSLDGQVLDGMGDFRRARLGIARTYQRLEVFPEMTVLEHLIVARSAHEGSTGVWRDLIGRGAPSPDELEHCHQVLAQVGLGGQASRVVGSLSLGSCRLVELARALVTDPLVLLADEPSSGLDEAESATLASLLRRLIDDGLSVALVEHDLDMVRSVADRTVVMDLGRVIADGSFDTVMQEPSVRRAYLGAST